MKTLPLFILLFIPFISLLSNPSSAIESPDEIMLEMEITPPKSTKAEVVSAFLFDTYVSIKMLGYTGNLYYEIYSVSNSFLSQSNETITGYCMITANSEINISIISLNNGIYSIRIYAGQTYFGTFTVN